MTLREIATVINLTEVKERNLLKLCQESSDRIYCIYDDRHFTILMKCHIFEWQFKINIFKKLLTFCIRTRNFVKENVDGIPFHLKNPFVLQTEFNLLQYTHDMEKIFFYF